MKWTWLTLCFLILLVQGSRGQENTTQKSEKVTNPLHGLFNMARGFIDVVAPSDKPIDLFLEMFNGSDVNWDKKGAELVKMEAGFIACLAAGLLMFIGMPIAGLFFCCCRCCCGNCGGKRVQHPKKGINSRRKAYTILFFISVVMMIISLAFCYLSAAWITQKVVPKSEKQVNLILEEIINFFGNTSEEMQKLTKQDLNDAAKDMENKVEDIRNDFGLPFQESCNKTISNSSETANKIDDDSTKINEILAASKQLISTAQSIKNILKTVEEGLDHKEKECKQTQIPLRKCEIKPKKIDFNDNISNHNIVNENLPNLTEEINEVIKKLPEDVVIKTKRQREDAIAKIVNATGDVSENDLHKEVTSIDQIKKDISETRDTIKKNFKYINDYDKNLWYTLAGMAGLLTIPTMLMCLGMFCGICGQRKGRHPAQRGGLSNCGGCTIIAAVYIIFLISWIPILLTVTLFQVGGHIEAYACSLAYEEDLKSFDKVYSNFIKQGKLNSSYLEQITPSQTFKDCKNGFPIYQAFKLNENFDLDNLKTELDLKRRINLDDISDTVKKEIAAVFKEDVLKNLKDIQSFDNNDMDAFLKNLEEDLVKELGLDNWITDLTRIDRDVKELNLTTEINELKEIKETRMPEYEKLKAKIQKNPTVSELIKNVQALSSKYERDLKLEDLENNASELTEKYLDGVVSIGTQYVDHVINEVKNNVGNCKPIWNAFDTGRHLVCRDVLDPINGYWFSMGWCLVFSIFAIAFGTKLAQHYLRMSDMKGGGWNGSIHSKETIQASTQIVNMKEHQPNRYQGQDNYYSTPGPKGSPYQLGNQDNQGYLDDRMNGWTEGPSGPPVRWENARWGEGPGGQPQRTGGPVGQWGGGNYN